MIGPYEDKAGNLMTTFVLPPNAYLTGVYPTHVLGCKLTPKGLASQREVKA